MAGASAAGLLACSDSVWEPPYATGGDQQMVAPVVSQPGLNADVDSLPSWETVVQGIGGPGCEFYFRRATGSYVSRKYELEYSSEANSGAKAAWARLHSIWVTVKRPKADGSEEVLPQQLAIWAVCLLPGTERGKLEVNGSVKAILKELGLEIPDKIWASARPPGGGRWATLGRLALGWTAPRSLFAAQTTIDPDCFDPVPSTKCVPPEMEELVATGTAGCPGLDLDFDAVEGPCSLSQFVLEGIETIPHTPTPAPPPSGSPGGPKEGPKEGGDEGSRVVEFSLACRSTTRGWSGGCSVSTQDSTVSLGDLTYAWETGAGAADTSGTGLSSWNGTATSTRSFTVTISGPDIAAKTLNGVVTVSRRPWSIARSSQTAQYLTPTWGWGAGDWGAFARHPGAFTTTTVSQGPWKEATYVTRTYDVTELYLHPDFLSNLLAPTYSTTGAVSAATLRQYCPAGWTGLGALANLNAVNGDCGTSGPYNAWHGTTLAHEQRHEAKYNQCVVSRTVSDLLAAIEELTGSDVANLPRLVPRLNTIIDDGKAGPMDAEESGDLWHHREVGFWTAGTASSDPHTGTPCS
ncbi:hypothetical protein [Candidatus Palauibacter sp.]|uniref:hypothetical protein n=1 Tax=Candidatus Palauibacter sp. TaxID=3101350 RepID=UPI003B5B6B3B